MANRIEKGGTYIAAILKEGESSNGKWKMIVVNNDSGKDGITCFVGPDTVDVDVKLNESFTVTEILSYNQKKRKDNEGKWIPANSINVNIAKVDAVFEDGTDPFNMGTNPFEEDPFANAKSSLDDGELPF